MRRLREISRFECDVRVLRNGFCMCLTSSLLDLMLTVLGRSAQSGDLVPGDVYEVSDPSLSQIPCDSLLLAGDCIINESMLTGTSGPPGFPRDTDLSRRVNTRLESPYHRRSSPICRSRCDFHSSKRSSLFPLLWYKNHPGETTSRHRR